MIDYCVVPFIQLEWNLVHEGSTVAYTASGGGIRKSFSVFSGHKFISTLYQQFYYSYGISKLYIFYCQGKYTYFTDMAYLSCLFSIGSSRWWCIKPLGCIEKGLITQARNIYVLPPTINVNPARSKNEIVPNYLKTRCFSVKSHHGL